jgi:hypothetical protein
MMERTVNAGAGDGWDRAAPAAHLRFSHPGQVNTCHERRWSDAVRPVTSAAGV